MSETFNRTNVEYDGRIYPAVELLNFTTADNVVVEYGYLPRNFIEKGNRIKENTNE